MAEKKLTDKQKAFVREYAIDKNATQAAIRAGYSKKTAYSIGEENLRKPEIAQELAKIEAEHAEKCAVTVESLCRELEADRALARQLEQPSAALTATMNVAKLHGLDVIRSEVTGKNGGPIKVEQKSIDFSKIPKADRKTLLEILDKLHGGSDGGEG
jgi:phage terminase small subunit